MVEKIIATVLCVIGAVLTYGAGKISQLIWKDKATEDKMLKIKFSGFGVILVALIILFV